MSNQPADEKLVPLTNSGQVVTTKRDKWQRFFRTAAQLIGGGALTAIVDLLANDISAEYVPYLYAINTAVFAYVQNYLEEKGLVPIFLKKPVVK